MYIPKHFEMQDQKDIYDFIEKHSFGIIVSTSQNMPTATHLPLLLDKKHGRLTGHFAKPNKQWHELEGQEVLIIFPGPHTYISSSWYETNQSVPTWNYVAVHVYGTVKIIQDPQELLASLKKLTEKYEGSDSSYHIDQTNEAYVHGLMKGIVGFQIEITKLEGKAKLSQNHSRERQERVIQELEKLKHSDAHEIAKLMKQNIHDQSN